MMQYLTVGVLIVCAFCMLINILLINTNKAKEEYTKKPKILKRHAMNNVLSAIIIYMYFSANPISALAVAIYLGISIALSIKNKDTNLEDGFFMLIAIGSTILLFAFSGVLFVFNILDPIYVFQFGIAFVIEWYLDYNLITKRRGR